MPDRLPFHTLDVFTSMPYCGNPLAVVLEADGLTTAQMQTIAREFNLSETIFVMAPSDPAHTAAVRIFFPTDEIPFAGHPTLGCAVHLAELHHGKGDFDTVVTLEEVAGLVPVELSRRGGTTRGTFKAPVLPVPASGSAPKRLSAQAFGLPESAIGFGAHRTAVYQGGPTFAYIPLADMASLAAASPLEPACTELMQEAGALGAYLYTPDPDVPGFRGRFFAPGIGVPEDPATGSASAILAAQLLASGTLEDGVSEFRLLQGVEMGRPSHLTLGVSVENGALTEVRVGGTAVAISQGYLTPPAA